MISRRSPDYNSNTIGIIQKKEDMIPPYRYYLAILSFFTDGKNDALALKSSLSLPNY